MQGVPQSRPRGNFDGLAVEDYFVLHTRFFSGRGSKSKPLGDNILDSRARGTYTAAMPRHILPEENIHPSIREQVAGHHRDIVDEVIAAVESHDVVVVGMAQNPFPRRARKALDAKGIAYHYLEYGSYLNNWRRRNALKMYTGWPTLPMIFVKGTFIGGASDLQKLIDSGELNTMLSGAGSDAA